MGEGVDPTGVVSVMVGIAVGEDGWCWDTGGSSDGGTGNVVICVEPGAASEGGEDAYIVDTAVTVVVSVVAEVAVTRTVAGSAKSVDNWTIDE